MGFNKTYIGLKNIIDNKDDLKRVFNRNSNVYIFSDSTSNLIYELYLKSEFKLIDSIIEKSCS